MSGGSRRYRALTGLLGAFLRPYAGQVSVVLALTLAQCAGNLCLPLLDSAIINTGVLGGDVRYIWRTGGLMLAISAGASVLAVAGTLLTSRVSMTVGGDIRLAVYRRTQSFSGREVAQFGVPSLVTRTMNDVQQVQLFLLMALSLLASAVIMIVGALALAVREAPGLALPLLVALPVLALAAVAGLVLLVPLNRSLQRQTDGISRVLREQITGVRVIRAFLRTQFEEDRFRAANAELTATGIRVNRIIAALLPIAAGAISLLAVAVIWFGGRQANAGTLPVGNLIPFLLYIFLILAYLIMGLLVIFFLSRAVASAERIRQVLDTTPAITEPPRAVTPETVSGAVEFRRVTFGYPGSGRPVLRELSLVLDPGRTIAIIGGTGSGKTTVLNLIVRLLDVTGGAVLVNGVDVRDQAAGPLRAAIGLVPQVPFLFAGTVASNLRLGRAEATDEELWHALEVAQASDFVAAMPGGLDAPIDQGGANVSGGQRQRLSIARALIRRPGLYLFDDSFSALDAVTDARLRAALRTETSNAAVLMVSQRVSTIMDADQIIVLDGGSVAGRGRHDELLAACPAYQEIVASQLGAGAAA